MRLFSWFRWQLERRTMQRRIDSLLSDLNQTMQEVTELRIASHEAQLLLHDAERGAKLAAEEQDNLKTQLELHKSAAAYWETVAKNQQKRIAELRRPASELTSVTESTEPAETELERRAWEMFVHSTHGFSGCFTQAFHWMIERDRRRKEQKGQE